MKFKIALLFIAVAAVLALSGCGEKGDDQNIRPEPKKLLHRTETCERIEPLSPTARLQRFSMPSPGAAVPRMRRRCLM